MTKTQKQNSITNYFAPPSASSSILSLSHLRPPLQQPLLLLHILRPSSLLLAWYALIRMNSASDEEFFNALPADSSSVPQTIAFPELVIRIQHPNTVRVPCCVDWFHRLMSQCWELGGGLKIICRKQIQRPSSTPWPTGITTEILSKRNRGAKAELEASSSGN
ncbi:hypothetical protein BC830DRAFT_163711 [Chytriomyces sp. MP71]|nr:hypothetical protein BC830DRAFT_163711 [Chytriomyces sp. MP71]